MAITQHRSKMKPTGARYLAARGKRKFEMGSPATMSKIGEKKVKIVKVRGGAEKTRTLTNNIINVLDPKTKKYSKVKITKVVETPANRNFVIRNILTKGAVVDTEKGKARITNRPGQEGTLNGVLI